MERWINSVMTEKGLALLSKLISGTRLSITRAVTGSGYVSPSTLTSQTAVSGEKQTLTFRQISYPEEGKCSLPCRLTNSGLNTGYTVKQVGLYATDPDEGEILFFITQAENGGGTDVPSESESPGYIAEWDFYFQFGQADSVELVVSPADTVTIAMHDQKADKTLGNVDSAVFAEKTMQAGKHLVFTTDGTGEAYTVEVPSVTELYIGLMITIVPHEVSTTTMPTLNVNGLGAKPLRQRLSSSSGTSAPGGHDNWLAYNHPVSVIFNGTQWVANIPRPSATYLYGDVPVENGGTGASDAETARENLGINAMLEDIANLHVWNKFDGDPSAYRTVEGKNFNVADVGEEVEYSDMIFCKEGIFYLVNPEKTTISTETEAEILRGKIVKHFDRSPLTNAYVFLKVSESATFREANYTIDESGDVYSVIQASNVEQYKAMGKKIAYVSSFASNTYPANGSDGTYWYTYKKQLGD